ncbi:MAG: hypothetical protein CMH60_03405 [Myxococcales bacterium]|nr:hypothetical protein [Myxococcales bacterium]|tara:strand:- start:262 stop:1665 length:1404 start_codon:yes stop_codon:yes gene_type:complete
MSENRKSLRRFGLLAAALVVLLLGVANLDELTGQAVGGEGDVAMGGCGGVPYEEGVLSQGAGREFEALQGMNTRPGEVVRQSDQGRDDDGAKDSRYIGSKSKGDEEDEGFDFALSSQAQAIVQELEGNPEMDQAQQDELYMELIGMIADQVAELFDALSQEDKGALEESMANIYGEDFDLEENENEEEQSGAAEMPSGYAGHEAAMGEANPNMEYAMEGDAGTDPGGAGQQGKSAGDGDGGDDVVACVVPEQYESAPGTYFCDMLSPGFDQECCSELTGEPPPEPEPEPEPPTQPPSCGAEIGSTFGLDRTLLRVKQKFENLGFLQKMRLCTDPFAMINWDLIVPLAGFPCAGKNDEIDCSLTYQICGRCHDFWDINYVLVGLMFRLCDYTFFTANSVTSLWKLKKGQVRDAVFYFLRYGYYSTNRSACTYINNNFLGTSATDAGLCKTNCQRKFRGPFKTHIPWIN